MSDHQLNPSRPSSKPAEVVTRGLKPSKPSSVSGEARTLTDKSTGTVKLTEK